MQQFAASRRFDCQLDAFSYTYAIQCWCKSNRPEARDAIARLLCQLDNVGATSWRHEGQEACGWILCHLSKCSVPERVELSHSYTRVQVKGDNKRMREHASSGRASKTWRLIVQKTQTNRIAAENRKNLPGEYNYICRTMITLDV